MATILDVLGDASSRFPNGASPRCSRLTFATHLWYADGDAAPGFWAQGPKQQNQQRILDVDGTRLVITAWYLPTTSPQDRAELEEILASIQIG